MKPKTDDTTNNDTITEGSPPEAISADAEALGKLQAENAELKAAMHLSDARAVVMAALAKAGARSPELLFDAVKGDLQFADDGKLENKSAILERMKTRFPEQFGYEKPTASIDGGAGNGGGITLTREALTKMKPAEVAALDWADVRRVLANG